MRYMENYCPNYKLQKERQEEDLKFLKKILFTDICILIFVILVAELIAMNGKRQNTLLKNSNSVAVEEIVNDSYENFTSKLKVGQIY